MRIIFLDFDGPLHPVSAIDGLSVDEFLFGGWAFWVYQRGLFRWRIMLEHLLALHPDVELVVHSSWRLHLSNTMLRNALGEVLARRFIGITSCELGRRAGIEEFVERSGVEHFLVIDDNRYAFGDFEQLVLVDHELGLSDWVVNQKIRAWLNETAPRTASTPELPAAE